MTSSKVSNKPANLEKIQTFHQKVSQDLAALAGIACSAIGDKLGLYKAMADSKPVTPSELAQKTGLNERYIKEWLINQAAGDYVRYDASSGKFWLPDENAAVLADEDSLYFTGGGIQAFSGLTRAIPRIAECFRTGAGLPWSEQDPDLFVGTERLFAPVYVNFLVQAFIPAVPGLKEQLESGIDMADVGCGHGVSTTVLAKAFPRSRFFGFDNHAPSIERATKLANDKGVSENAKFQVSTAYDFPGTKYGCVGFFDSLHDLGDPVAACARAAQLLSSDGYLFIVEPQGGNKIEDNFNVEGRTLSAASVLCCTPNAMAGGKHALGTIAPDEELAKVVKAGGFKTFRRVFETPYNRVFEARL